uniref:Uncharacterized protein n=1 Tax=Rhipicephalus microplus TaxID=6941 RepID=A0A6M2DCE8_RHIMP
MKSATVFGGFLISPAMSSCLTDRMSRRIFFSGMSRLAWWKSLIISPVNIATFSFGICIRVSRKAAAFYLRTTRREKRSVKVVRNLVRQTSQVVRLCF